MISLYVTKELKYELEKYIKGFQKYTDWEVPTLTLI